MPKKLPKVLHIFFYFVLIVWLGVVLIVGDSGVRDKRAYQQDRATLLRAVEEAKKDIEQMTADYHALQQMESPDQNFLIKQGKKLDDVIIFKIVDQKNQDSFPTPQQNPKNTLFLAIISLFIFFSIVLLGFVFHSRNTKKSLPKKDVYL